MTWAFSVLYYREKVYITRVGGAASLQCDMEYLAGNLKFMHCGRISINALLSMVAVHGCYP